MNVVLPDSFPETLDLARFFSGRASAWGMVSDRRGRVRRRFHAEIEGRRDGGALVLDEQFRFDDGGTDRRVWRIEGQDGLHVGRAADVVGEARGQVEGATFRWSYDLKLPVGRRQVRVRFTDWMVQTDRDVLLSRSEIRKFGLLLGEVTMAFRRIPDLRG